MPDNIVLKLNKQLIAILGLQLGILGFASTVAAQARDDSPVLLIESGPSDNPEYRRMVFVKFLSGNRVGVNYKAYNRAEFIQVPNTTASDIVAACANGVSTPLSEITAFEHDEAKGRNAGRAPKLVRFCIKNIQNWEGGNRDRYLDPIFEGLPHAASLKN